MAGEDIYANIDELSEDHIERNREINTYRNNQNERKHQAVELKRNGPEVSENNPGKTSSCSTAALILGLLCLLLLAGLITLVVLYTKGSSEMVQLQTSYANLTKVKDQLQTSYNNLTKERNNLQTKLQNTAKFLGWSYFSGSIYYISSALKSWDESRTFCLQRGADLLVINSPEEQNFTRGFKKRAWLGLNHTTTNWRWVDGTPLNMRYWALEPSNPGGNKSCAEIFTYDLEKCWNDQECSFLNRWICEKTV